MNRTTGMGGPARIQSPLKPTTKNSGSITTGVLAGVDNNTNPSFVSVYVDNKFPALSNFICPANSGKFGPGGGVGFDHLYNNINNLGGEIVLIDKDKQVILQFTGKYSQVAPTQVITKTSTRTHVGNLNPPTVPAVLPIQINSSNSHLGGFPYYVSSRNILTPVLTSGDVVASAFGSDFTLVGALYKQTVVQTTSTVGITLPIGSWLFTDWYSKNTGTADFGPAISDGTHYYYVDFSNTTGFVTLYRDSVALYQVAGFIGDVNLHKFILSLTYLGGTSYRLKCWLDGVEQFDYTDSTGIKTTVYPSFKGTINQIFHADMDFYGTTDNALLLENPTSTAPVLSSISITYPLYVSSSNFVAKVSFTTSPSAPWQEGIRISWTGNYIDIPVVSGGNYTALIELSSNQTLSARFVDLTGSVSSAATIGTTSASGSTGSAGPGITPVQTAYPSDFSYVENIGLSTYDALSSIYLNSAGTTSSAWLIAIECVSSPTGVGTWTLRGTIPPNGSGSYQALWDNLSNAVRYDLGIRYLDAQGNHSPVYVVGTTSVPPVFVTPLPVPTGIPVAPIVNPSSIVITPTVSQTDNIHQAGSLQDFAVSLEVTNVPQDFSVDRVLYAFRRYGAPGTGAGSIVKEYFGVISSGGTLSSVPSTPNTGLSFDSTGTYVPTDGNLVIFGLSENISLLSSGYTEASSGHDTVWYKVWDHTVDSVNTLLSGRHICYTAYEISSAIDLDVSSSIIFSGTSASTGTLIPTSNNDIVISIFSSRNGSGLYDPSPTSPTWTNGISYDGYSTLTYSGPGGPDSGTIFGGSLTGLPLSPFSSTVTLGSEWSSETGLCLTTLLIKVNNPPATYPWTDYAVTQLQGLPIPPQIQTNTGTYGQLAVGIAYDLSLQYVSKFNVVSPRTIYESNYLSPIKLVFPGTVSGINLIVDSSLLSSTFNDHGNPAKSGANLNWKFFNINGTDKYIGKGGDSQGDNFVAITSSASGVDFRAISEPITVIPGSKYMIGAYVDTTSSIGGSTGGAYIAIVDYTGSNTFTTVYAKKTQSSGNRGVIQLDTAWLVPGGVTQACFMYNSDQMTISNILVMSQPIFEAGTILTGYAKGPANASDGSVRSPLSVAQTFVANTGPDATTIATSPTTTASTVTPTNGGGAPDKDKQPQGSMRQVQPGSGVGSVWIQTSTTSSSPVWIQVPIIDYSVLFAANIF